MRYRADVTDVVYLYDGSFAGFLCCVFESYSRHELPSAVCGPQEAQLTLYENRTIDADDAKAARVWQGLARCGDEVRNRIGTGFLSTDAGKDRVLLCYARLAFEVGRSAARMTGDEVGAAAFALERAVNNEACYCREFLRFEQHGRMLGAVLHPRHRVLPLLRAHFCDRLPDEEFLIFDATHGAAMLRRGDNVQYFAMESWQPPRQDDELDWQLLWKRFFDATTIESRRNPRCQARVCPDHWRPDMPEMQPLGKDRQARRVETLPNGFAAPAPKQLTEQAEEQRPGGVLLFGGGVV